MHHRFNLLKIDWIGHGGIILYVLVNNLNNFVNTIIKEQPWVGLRNVIHKWIKFEKYYLKNIRIYFFRIILFRVKLIWLVRLRTFLCGSKNTPLAYAAMWFQIEMYGLLVAYSFLSHKCHAVKRSTIIFSKKKQHYESFIFDKYFFLILRNTHPWK